MPVCAQSITISFALVWLECAAVVKATDEMYAKPIKEMELYFSVTD